MVGKVITAVERGRVPRVAGAAHVWLLEKTEYRALINALDTWHSAEHPVRSFEVLRGFELRVPNLREAGLVARARGKNLLVRGEIAGVDPALYNELVVADVTGPSYVGCPACQLGAHVMLCRLLDDGLALVAVSRDAMRTAPWLQELLDGFEGPSAAATDAASAIFVGLDDAVRRRNDAAMAVASYLACHPRVKRVWYPGLPDHPDHEVAASQLVGGFGPWVGYETAEERHRVYCDDDPFERCAQLEQILKE